MHHGSAMVMGTDRGTMYYVGVSHGRRKIRLCRTTSRKRFMGALKKLSSVESALEKVLKAYDTAFDKGYVVKKYSYTVMAYSETEGYCRSMKYKKPTVMCIVRIVGGKIKDIQFERDELYPEQSVWSKVVTDGYEPRKDALTRFMGTDHPFRTADENCTWDTMLHNMRDFAVYG